MSTQQIEKLTEEVKELKKEFKNVQIILKAIFPIVKLSASEKKSLERARREMKKGEYITLKTLEHELGSTRRKNRGKKSQKSS